MIVFRYRKTDISAPFDESALVGLPLFFRERISSKKNHAARAESLEGAGILLELLRETGISPDSLDFFVGENGRPCASFRQKKQKNMLPPDFFDSDESQKNTESSGENFDNATGSAKILNNPAEAFRGIDFNVSHSSGLVAVALALGDDAKVGIDVEKIGKGNEKKLAERWFSPREIEFLESGESLSVDFARIWTRKEAMLKYTGDGIARGILAADSFSPPENTAFTELITPDGFVITLCHESGDTPKQGVGK